ncbi:MAG: zinc ribbon domain-containing protein, partial [Oscillospiraceae bacterium]
PLSGLITCDECGSRYIRTIWYSENGENTAVWRCKERLKSGISNCNKSPTLKEDAVYGILIEIFHSIFISDIEESSAMVLQTKAAIVKLFGSKEVEAKSIENIRLSDIIYSITATTEKQIDIKFKTGLVLTKDLC